MNRRPLLDGVCKEGHAKRSHSIDTSSHTAPHSRADVRHLHEKAVFTAPLSRNPSGKHEGAPYLSGPILGAPQGYIPHRFVPPVVMEPTHTDVPGPPPAIPYSDEWDTLADLLRDHDSMKIANCNGDIDSLLIFTGLFSAIVAAFTVESYKALQPDPALHSIRLLEQLVLHFNGTEALRAAGSPVDVGAEPSSPDLVVNVFWFLSLIFTLSTASLGVFVKQWLRYYLDWSCSSSVERIRVRHFRYEGLMRWRVFEIAAFLPLLLQVALLLFLLGLVVFLRPINITVGWVVTIAVLIWIAVLVFILASPFLSAHCPYHISILWNAAGTFRGMMARIRHGKHWIIRRGYKSPYYRFPGDERGIRREPELGVDAVISADASLLDNAILQETLLPCARTFSMHGTVKFVRKVVSHRLGRPVPSLHDVDTNEYNLIPTNALDVLLDVLCDRLERASTLLQDPIADTIQRHEGLLELAVCFYAAANSAAASASKRYMRIPAWSRASVLLGSQSIRTLFLDHESLGIRLVSYRNAEIFARLLMNTPGVLIQASGLDSPRSIQNLIRGGLTLMEDLDGPKAISLARGIFEYIEAVPTDILRQSQGDISKLVFAISLAIQARRTVVERGSQAYIDVQRALDAAIKLNSWGAGEVVSRDLNRLLQNYSATGTFVEPPQPAHPDNLPSSPPFIQPVPVFPEQQPVRHRDQPQYHAVEVHPRH
ncbi:hypothetical protein QCA50_011355 [Cerrena zonata]|uniref:DUF6535 domain-containing protein n=1 Tax=Cerrena zonata TaxID=2478898 RepID=A0AAW0FX71_9APHY